MTKLYLAIPCYNEEEVLRDSASKLAQKYNDIADYEGYINGEYAFITGYYIVHQKVAIFAPNGEYSVTYYNRDTNPASSNYLKWVKYKVVGKKFDNGVWTDRTTFQDEIDRTDYKW